MGVNNHLTTKLTSLIRIIDNETSSTEPWPNPQQQAQAPAQAQSQTLCLNIILFPHSFRHVYFVLMQEGAHHGKVRSKSVRGPLTTWGSVGDLFGTVRGSVGPISDQNFSEPKIQNFKNV